MFKRICLALAGLAFALTCNVASAVKAKSPDFTAADLASKGLVLLSTSADHTTTVRQTTFNLTRIGGESAGRG